DLTTVACNGLRHLYCLQTGVGGALPAVADSGRIAFVTSASGSGDLSSWPAANGESGVAAGDAICQGSARAAGLPEPSTFKAWLSSDHIRISDRIVYDGPWIRPDRVRVANDLADLTDGFVRAPINEDEHGVYGDNGTWTGTAADGSLAGSCGVEWDYGAGGSTGEGGLAGMADGTWTAETPAGCELPRSLYCLQDVPLLLVDGFESGDLQLWEVSP